MNNRTALTKMSHHLNTAQRIQNALVDNPNENVLRFAGYFYKENLVKAKQAAIHALYWRANNANTKRFAPNMGIYSDR